MRTVEEHQAAFASAGSDPHKLAEAFGEAMTDLEGARAGRDAALAEAREHMRQKNQALQTLQAHQRDAEKGHAEMKARAEAAEGALRSVLECNTLDEAHALAFLTVAQGRRARPEGAGEKAHAPAVTMVLNVRPDVLRGAAARACVEGAPDATAGVLAELAAERARQDAQWGACDYPSVDPRLEGSSGERVCAVYGVLSEQRAKHLNRTSDPQTWAHVTVEELAEALSAPDDTARRAELVQLGAVCVWWVEAIDRRLGAQKGGGDAGR